MTKTDLINLILTDEKITATLDKVTEEYQDDFKQHFYLQLLEQTEEKLLEQYLKCDMCLQRYAGSILKLQLKSNNSSFHNQYRRKYPVQNALNHYYDTAAVNEQEIIDKQSREQELIAEILRALNHVHPKKSKLFYEYYFNHKTIRQISKQYKIKYRTVHYNIKAAEAILRVHFAGKWNA